MPAKSHLLLLSLALVFLLFPHTAAHAVTGGPEPAGTIVALRGEVRILRRGTRYTPRVKDHVFEHDVINTGATGRVQLLFRDHTLISLGVNTETAIDTYRFRPQEKEAAMQTTVKEGVLRVVGGVITKMAPENFTTETPTATIGIRGSMYLVRCSITRTDAVFLGGRGIFVRNRHGRVELDTPGFGTRVEADSAPTPARRISGDEIKALEKATTGTADSQPKNDQQHPQDHTPKDSSPDSAPTSSPLPSDDDGGTESSPLRQTATETTKTPLTGPRDQPATDTIPTLITTVDQTAGQSMLEDTTQALVDTHLADTGTDSGNGSGSGTGAGTGAGTPLALSGHSLAAFSGANSGRLFSASTAGSNATGTNTAGSVTGQADYANGTIFPLDFTMAPPNATGTTASLQVVTGLPVVRNLLNIDRSFATTELFSSSLGDFSYLLVDMAPFTTALDTYSYSELTSLGAQPTSLPTGLSLYSGDLLTVYQDSVGTPLATELQQLDVAVNWTGNKLLGFVTPDTTQEYSLLITTYFIADVAGDTINNIRFFGSGNEPMYLDISAIQGIGRSAGFYGFLGEGLAGSGVIDFRGIGTDMSIPQASAEVALAALQTSLPSGLQPAATNTTAQFQGFAVGIAEDITNIDSNRRLFMSGPGDFNCTMDRAGGTVTGSLTVTDTVDSTVKLNGMTVGGSGKSAYIADNVFFAEITDGGTGPVQNGTATGPLKQAGNYLVSAHPAGQPATYATWGYWETAFQDPATLADYHLHVPYSLWVTGQHTPAAEVQGLIDTGVLATYSGKAYGTVTDTGLPGGQVTMLPEGTLDLTIDFGKTLAAGAVTGAITFPNDPISGFPGRALTIGSAASALDSNGFQAMVTDPGVTGSRINGAFYGPAAKSVAGNFRADYGTEHYLGIFVGDRP